MTQHIERPLVRCDEPAAGFYALNGESVLTLPTDQKKEQLCNFFVMIREQNPDKRILFVLDSSFVCEYTRKRASTWDRSRVSSGRITGFEPNRAGLKESETEASPMIVESAEAFRALVADTVGQR